MSKTFKELYELQRKNQQDMIKAGMYDDYIDFVTKSEKEIPFDHPKLASYHIQQLVSEIGEVLEADKRWKNIRNGKYNKQHKLDEISDCFIVLLNIAMFSGYTDEELFNAIESKINVVSNRIKEERKMGGQ